MGILTADRLTLLTIALAVFLQALILYRQQFPVQTTAAPGVPTSTTSTGPFVDAPETATIELTNIPILGEDDTSIVLLAFSDYECPFCERHYAEVFPELQERFIDVGRVRYGHMNLPLAMHPNASFESTVAVCAGLQGFYWEVQSSLFSLSVSASTLDEVISSLETFGIDAGVLQNCLRSDPMPASVAARDSAVARQLGLTATPSFAIGRVVVPGVMKVENLVIGAQPLDVFAEAIEQLE